MQAIPHGRLIGIDAHDDGVDSWSMTRIAPPPALAGLIDGYCDYHERTGSFTERRELPHAEGVMIVNLGDPIIITGGDGAAITIGPGEAFVAGVHQRAALSRSNGAQAGMHIFLPLPSVRRLLDAPMTEMVDRVVPLDALLGHAARMLGRSLREATGLAERVALLDRALQQRLARSAALCPQQAHAIDRLRRRPDLDIMTIARDIGWSRKHLADRVRDAVGVGPRSFRRLLRFQQVTAAAARSDRPDWAALAHDGGYCDQSHLIREFREFAGMTPGMFADRLLESGGGLIES